MTKELLLIKRYKCIAPIPFQPFPDMYNVGDIFTDNGKTAILNQNGDPVCIVEWDKYPHLFQPLPWWSDRKPEDLPTYVKTWNSNKTKCFIRKMGRDLQWNYGEENGEPVLYGIKNGNHGRMMMDYIEPATEEECQE